MGKMAHAVADNLLVTTYLSAKCPVMIAPAMDLDMYKHPANLKNIETLKSYGNLIVEPESGELASGLVGKGRMAEPEVITQQIIDFFTSKKKLKFKKVLVTAGPTYEPIDPVRFIGNYSSGKMGYAIAEELAEQGAEVILVSGPTNLNVQNPNINKIGVQTAQEMYENCIKYFPDCDAAIMSAAVADYRPSEQFEKKVKRTADDMHITLEPNKDIAAELGKIKKKNQLLVGFALETDNEFENAQKKINTKNLDFIVLNSLKDKGAGFGVDTNKISVIDNMGNQNKYELKQKYEVAVDIVNELICRMNK